MRQLVVILGLAGLAGCSLTQPQDDPVQIKLQELDGRVARIERVVTNQSLLDLAQRIDALERDLRALHGQIEELQNNNDALRKQQRDLYSDLEKRLSAVPASGGGGGISVGAQVAGEQAAYTQAFDALKAANYPTAIAGFGQFLSSYPTSELAENAQYWLGEAYYVTRDYEKAAQAFGIVGQRWPQSRKSADALLKLGFSQYELKRYPQARESLQEVTRRFPDSDAAKLAADRLQRLPAGAR